MKQDKNFLNALDDWGNVLTDTYERANDFHTLFVGVIKGESYPFNINLIDYKKLFELKPVVSLGYEYYYGATITIDKELFNLTVNTAPYFKDLDVIEFNLNLMGIDLELLYNYDIISKEEYESGQLENDYTDLQLQIRYNSKTNNNLNYVSFDIGSQNEPSDYTPTSTDEIHIVYFNHKFAEHILESSIETYKRETDYMEMTNSTKNRMLKLIDDVNKQNSGYCLNNVKNFKY